MKVACLVLAYAGAPVLARTLPLLRAAGWDVFIHLDKKVARTTYQAAMGIPLPDGCTFVEDPVEVFWGGYSMVRAELKLLAMARDAGPYEKYLLISDDSFPVHTTDMLAKHFSNPEDQISLVPQPERSPFYARYHGFYCYDHHVTAIRTPDRRQGLIDPELEEKVAEIAVLRKMGKTPLQVYYGSQFWALTDASVVMVLQVVGNDQRLVKSFEYAALSDELMIQSILGNYKYKGRMDTAPIYADMTTGNPRVFTSFSALPLDIQVTHAFIRKISPSARGLHDRMVALLEQRHSLVNIGLRHTEHPHGSEADSETAQPVRLTAPEESTGKVWHGIESFWGRRFRWTAEDTIAWDLPPDQIRIGRVRFVINTVIAPSPSFVAGSRLSFCGETKPVEMDGGVLSATFRCSRVDTRRVVLTTPKLLSPREVSGRPDTRRLGLAIAL